jgi:hypothetical protein
VHLWSWDDLQPYDQAQALEMKASEVDITLRIFSTTEEYLHSHTEYCKLQRVSSHYSSVTMPSLSPPPAETSTSKPVEAKPADAKPEPDRARPRSRSPRRSPPRKPKNFSGLKYKDDKRDTRDRDDRRRDDRGSDRRDRRDHDRDDRRRDDRNDCRRDDRFSDRRGDDRRRDDRRDDRRRDDRHPDRRGDDRHPDRRHDDRDHKPKEPRDKKPGAAPIASTGEAMIIVTVNDRLGTKTQVPCLPSDPVKVLKAMVAAKIGRPVHEIMLKRQGERPFHDQLSLADYSISNGVQIDLELNTGD